MKKKIIIVFSLVILLIAVLVGCKNTLVPGDVTVLYNPKDDGMQIVKDLDSYEVMQQAFSYYKNNQKYKMVVDFKFNASPNFAYQVTKQTIIRNNGEYYEEYIAMGTGGAKKKNKGNQFYYNNGSVKAKYIQEKDMTLDKENHAVTADFSKTSWGSFIKSNENDGISTPLDKVNLTKDKIHQYILGDNYIDRSTDKLVYQRDNQYYCSIILSTKEMDNNNYQSRVVKAIEAATEGKFVKFNENTRMVAELEKVGETFRFKQFILMEDYTGKVSVASLQVSQQYWHKFYYDAESLKMPV